jgi:hypothetical protein
MQLDALTNITPCHDDVASVPGVEYSLVKLGDLAQYEKDATIGLILVVTTRLYWNRSIC